MLILGENGWRKNPGCHVFLPHILFSLSLPPPIPLPAPSSDPPLFAIDRFTVGMKSRKYLLHAPLVFPSANYSVKRLPCLSGSSIYFTPISTTSETLVGGRHPLLFVIGCAEVTLARVNLPSIYLLYQKLAVFSPNCFL